MSNYAEMRNERTRKLSVNFPLLSTLWWAAGSCFFSGLLMTVDLEKLKEEWFTIVFCVPVIVLLSYYITRFWFSLLCGSINRVFLLSGGVRRGYLFL